jgi:RNA polymerase sigma factor (sigma-70 family)
MNTPVPPVALPPFQTLIDAHRAEVLGFLRAVVGPQEAEDCFQETFLAALRAYPRADARNLRAWIFTIARRKAIDHHRRRVHLPNPVPDPPGKAGGAAMDGESEIWSLVAALPPKQRAAVALRFVGDLRYRDVATALGCTEAAARRRVHDGLRNLRGALERKEAG